MWEGDMAHDDMHVLMYKVLAYPYRCMKEGVAPDVEKVSCGGVCRPPENRGSFNKKAAPWDGWFPDFHFLSACYRFTYIA